MPTKHQWYKSYSPGYPSLLLMHCDGSNGGTTFTDSSSYNRTISRDGEVNTSTAQKKFGTASAYFDGTGDDLYGSYSNLVLGAGDFTVDFWIYPTEAREASIFETRAKGGAAVQAGSINISMYNTGKLLVGSASGIVIPLTTATVSINTWSHIALVRSGTSLKLYLNGTEVGSATFTTDLTAQGLTIGRYADAASGYYKGHMDELHMLSGFAQWTAGFTPPTSAYAL